LLLFYLFSKLEKGYFKHRKEDLSDFFEKTAWIITSQSESGLQCQVNMKKIKEKFEIAE
jgi:hypothetical protein